LSNNGSENGQMVYLTSNSGSLTQGFYYWNGTQWANIATKVRKVDNELYFEDTNFRYISLRVNTTDWEVIRYSKISINTEAYTSGTGAQPSVLTDIQALTFN